MNEVIEAYSGASAGNLCEATIDAKLNDCRASDKCDGYWYAKAGIEHVAG
jgi:hypothetical protein